MTLCSTMLRNMLTSYSRPYTHPPRILTSTELCSLMAGSMRLICMCLVQIAAGNKLTRVSIAHLVGFALKLRNLGVSDHGLVRELSVPLAGSLYSGEGHSRLYYEDQVYDLAVAHALETTDIPALARNRRCEIAHSHRPATSGSTTSAATQTTGTGSVRGGSASSVALANPNPYHLPWIMRGLLEENFVKTELSSETEELLQQFDDWKPVTKALKDVKYRLEAVRSRL